MALSCIDIERVLKHAGLWQVSQNIDSHRKTMVFSLITIQRYIDQSHSPAIDTAKHGVVVFRGHSFDHHHLLKDLCSLAVKPPVVILESIDHIESLKDQVYILVSSARRAWSVLMYAIVGGSCDTGRIMPGLRFIGITGTNGKTSTTLMLFSLLKHYGLSALALGTFGARWHLEDQHQMYDHLPLVGTHTTQDPDVLYPLLHAAESFGVCWVVMEVSSHSLHQEKLYPIVFDFVVATSFSHDHLDYHGSMEEYLFQKLKLFSAPYMQQHSCALISPQFLQNIEENKVYHRLFQGVFQDGMGYTQLSRYIYAPPCDLHIYLDGHAQPRWLSMCTPCLGSMMQENMLMACELAACVTKIPFMDILRDVAASPELMDIAGRMQQLSDKPVVVVDYAHTPDALRKALIALKAVYPGYKLLCVVGCGGDRDTLKRPMMARIAMTYGDEAIFTTDNPRYEEPKNILQDMWQGVSLGQRDRAQIIVDRRQAIQEACTRAQNNQDSVCVLVAGRGDEQSQQIAGKSYPLRDADMIYEYLSMIDGV